ncbi:MAG: carboxypeptidase-like regulatory domain-containing protein [Xanthomonadales bacterium]|nr:carboxypeptidase-like regulatory domain-containing protein [Xanthomonadales bacterium]
MKPLKILILACLLVPAVAFAAGQSHFDESGTINGNVYCDQDEDGKCNCAEQGIEDMHIQIFATQCGGTPLQTIHTDKKGNFSFHVPKPGHYYVMVDLDYVCGGRIPTTQNCRQVDLQAGETVTLEPFGYSIYGK